MLTPVESNQLDRLERKVDELKHLVTGKLEETDRTLQKVENLLTTTPSDSELMSQKELLGAVRALAYRGKSKEKCWI